MKYSVTGMVRGLFDAPADLIVTVPRAGMKCVVGTSFSVAEIVTTAGVRPEETETWSQGLSLAALQYSGLTVLVIRTRSDRKTQFRVVPGW